MIPHVDIAEMHYTACKFSDCADFCMREQWKRKTFQYFYTDPPIVNAAFSCEVFLKLLLHLDQIDFQKSHKLKQLFEMLPPEIMETVKYQTVQKCGHWKDLWNQDILSQVSNAFEKWRYIYEINWTKNRTIDFDISFLLAFRDALRIECEKRLQGNGKAQLEEVL